MIAFSAVLVGWESLQRLFEPAEVSNVGLLAAAGVVGFMGNELVAIYRIRVGNEIGSQALIADGLHARTDGLTSIGVVIAAVGVWLGFPLADPIIGLVITVAILWILRDAARSVFRRLMDAVDPKLVDDIEHVAADVDGVMEVEKVRVRWNGHRLIGSIDLVVDCQSTVAQGHDVAERVRHALFHKVGRLNTVIVHLDPCEHGDSDHHAETRSHDETLAPRQASEG
jgi:cation diffusion facilitator family transporter